MKFYLSQSPFAQAKPALIDEEYLGPSLDPTTWVVNDPSSAVSVVAQTLQIAGGTHNVIYAATVNNSVYAFDADALGAPLWFKNFNGIGQPLQGTYSITVGRGA